MAFREVSAPDLIKWEKVGDKVEGEYLGKKSVETDLGESDVHIVRLDNGAKVAFFAPALLESALTDEVERGNQIQITFIGEEPAKKRGHSPTKKFKVLVDDGN